MTVRMSQEPTRRTAPSSTRTGIALAAALLAFPAVASAAGSVTGTVKLVGKPPAPAALNMKGDPFCAKLPEAKDEAVVVGKGGELKNVVVRIAKGAKPAGAPPSTPAVMDQTGCAYQPRVLVVQAGQMVEIRNSDMTMHNVHTYKKNPDPSKPDATLFNLAHVQGTGPKKKTFPTVGDVIKFKCDVHPWMTGWVLVTDNPHHAITGADGKFNLADLPPGSYTVEAWHESYGSQTKQVTVAEGKPVDLKLEFKAK